MARGIIHYNGVYNVWSTVVDSPLFVSGFTRRMIEQWAQEEYGNQGLKDLPARLELAHKQGTDDTGPGLTLDDLIEVNRAGPNESHMSKDDFLKKFFTVEARFLEQEQKHGR